MTIGKKLSREKGGNVLIEFALLAPVFFMLIMGLIEFVLFQYKTYALNHVVAEAVRNLQTGEIKTAGNTQQAFLDEMCAHAGLMIDCNEIDYDVRHYETLAEIKFHEPTFNDEGRQTNLKFDPGGASSYSVVVASSPHNFVTPFMNELMGVTDDKRAVTSSFNVVRNEPWN